MHIDVYRVYFLIFLVISSYLLQDIFASRFFNAHSITWNQLNWVRVIYLYWNCLPCLKISIGFPYLYLSLCRRQKLITNDLFGLTVGIYVFSQVVYICRTNICKKLFLYVYICKFLSGSYFAVFVIDKSRLMWVRSACVVNALYSRCLGSSISHGQASLVMCLCLHDSPFLVSYWSKFAVTHSLHNSERCTGAVADCSTTWGSGRQ